jgi:type II secretion system protein N
MALHLGPRARKLVRILGLALLGVVTFVFAVQATFPYDRVKAKIIEALSTKYDVTIGDVSRGLMPGSMSLKAVTLRSRPSKAGDVPTVFFIENLDVHLGLLALLHGGATIDLDAKIGPGHIDGQIALAPSGTGVHLHGHELPSVSLPMRDAIGLPMSGKVDFDVDLDLPTVKDKFGKAAPDWSKAEGDVEFQCLGGCVIGNGKSKLKPKLNNSRSQAFAADGIEFGKINLDRFVAEVQFTHGKADVKRWEVKSADGELHVEVSITLQPELGESLISGCLRYNVTDTLLKREARTHAAITTMGAPLGPDHLFHIRLDGRVKETRRIGQVCGAAAGVGMDDVSGGGGGGPKRPQVTVQPDPPTTTPPPPPTATPPPPPPVTTPPPPPTTTPNAGATMTPNAPPAAPGGPPTGGLPTPTVGGTPVAPPAPGSPPPPGQFPTPEAAPPAGGAAGSSGVGTP